VATFPVYVCGKKTVVFLLMEELLVGTLAGVLHWPTTLLGLLSQYLHRDTCLVITNGLCVHKVRLYGTEMREDVQVDQERYNAPVVLSSFLDGFAVKWGRIAPLKPGWQLTLYSFDHWIMQWTSLGILPLRHLEFPNTIQGYHERSSTLLVAAGVLKERPLRHTTDKC
jgi:hypothetical protein